MRFAFVLLASIFPGATEFALSAGVDNFNVKGLPKDALIIETQRLPKTSNADRVLVLWMEHPVRYDRHIGNDEVYNCPDFTRGSYYRGPTRVSLVDSRSGYMINTVRIVYELNNWEDDSFDLPYRLRPAYYRVLPPLLAGEGKAKILALQDYNGDGNALEFVLYDAEGCSSVNTQLIGYSIRTDRVIRYPIRISGEWLANLPPTVHWISNWLTRSSTAPGYWHYREEYNSGAACVWDIRYNVKHEEFAALVNCN